VATGCDDIGYVTIVSEFPEIPQLADKPQ